MIAMCIFCIFNVRFHPLHIRGSSRCVLETLTGEVLHYGLCAAHALINNCLLSAIVQLKGKSFKCLLSEYCFQVFLTFC